MVLHLYSHTNTEALKNQFYNTINIKCNKNKIQSTESPMVSGVYVKH